MRIWRKINTIIIIVIAAGMVLIGCDMFRKNNDDSDWGVDGPMIDQTEQDYTQEIIKFICCEYELIENVKNVKQVMQRYDELKNQGKREGFTPVLIVPSENLYEMFRFQSTEGYSRDETIKNAESIDVQKFFENRKAEVLADSEDCDVYGEFVAGEPANEFETLYDYESSGLAGSIVAAKLPTDKPWEAAAWIPMGGFNECPAPEEQTAVFRYWYEKNAAIPAVVRYDTWELFVENPVSTQEDAKTLAAEQFFFCSDNVWQGSETVNALAGILVDSSVWNFWWD